MEFMENADVLTSDERKVGRIDRVVVDPGTGAVTHLVVKKGLLLTHDKVVPVDEVDIATENRVLLKKTADNPDDFPDFEETQYIPVGGIEDFNERESEQARRLLWYHTWINVAWWGKGPNPNRSKPLFVKKTRRNIPEGSIPLEEGAKVVDAGGEAIGEVQEIYAERKEHRVTHILITRGIIAKDEKLIPSAWIKDIFEDSVRLSVGKEVIESLPNYVLTP